MLLREEGDTLVLAGTIPRPWLGPGKTVAVNDAPTVFGKASYRISMARNGQSASIQITAPDRGAESSGKIIVRLRHPEGREIKSVEAPGGVSAVADGDRITLRWPNAPLKLKAVF